MESIGIVGARLQACANWGFWWGYTNPILKYNAILYAGDSLPHFANGTRVFHMSFDADKGAGSEVCAWNMGIYLKAVFYHIASSTGRYALLPSVIGELFFVKKW